MEELLKEIIEGKEAIDKLRSQQQWWSDTRGKGTKAYVTKRIDLLREMLLEMKKGL